MSISYPNLFQDGRVTYDLTGTNPSFKKQITLTYYKDGDQVIEFPWPVYVKASKAQTTGGAVPAEGSPDTLKVVYRKQNPSAEVPSYEDVVLDYVKEPGAGATNFWSTSAEGEDETAMAKAHELAGEHDSLNNDFKGVIVKKIRINISGEQGTTVVITVQRFLMELTESAKFKGGDGPTYSPAFGKYILDTLDDLKVRSDIMVRNMFGKTHSASDILSEDLTGEDSDNRVEFELHTDINTTAGKTLLAPARGSFYPGVADSPTEFKMFKYATEELTISETHVHDGTLNGQVFIFTINNLRVFSAILDGTFIQGRTYYKDGAADGLTTSGYTKMVPGTAEQVEAGEADYTVGGDIYAWSEKHHNRPVYELVNVPMDPSKGFDGAINDSSMYISKEVQVLLTAANVSQYIGYKGTIVYVKDTGDPTTKPEQLVKGEDYEFTSCNLAKTAKTTSKQAVYDYVRILAPMVEDDSSRVIGISYQAFGGEVSAEDVRNMRMDLSNLLKVITQNGLMTADNLSRHEIIKDLYARLRSIETYNNYFSRVDHTVSKSYTGFHWLSIAKLWDVSFMAELGAIKELGTFRVSSKEMGWAYEFMASVDLSKSGDDAFKVTVIGAHSNASDDITDTTSVLDTEQLALRLCWDTSEDGLASGAVLQLGIDFSKYEATFTPTPTVPATSNDFDVISVVNKSGPTSLWTLCYDPLEASQADEGLYRVYGHMQLELTSDPTAVGGKAYYNRDEQYLYFLTSDTYARDGKHYYKKESSSFVEQTIAPGTVIASLGYAVYEREISGYERKIMTIATGAVIPGDGTVYEANEVSNNDDTGFTLPDGKTVWNAYATGGNSVSVTRFIGANNDGIIAWTGNAQLALTTFAPDRAPTKLTLSSCLEATAQPYVNVSGISAIGVGIMDRKTGAAIYRKMNAWVVTQLLQGGGAEKRIRAEDMFFMEDLGGINVTVRRANDEIYFEVEAGMGTNSYLNDRFFLRQIRLYF